MGPDEVEFIGYVAGRDVSEIRAPSGPALDPAFIVASASVQESGGFDRVLVASHATQPDSLVIAAQIALATRRLKLMIAHRPGFIAPTYAARQFATLDQISGGRVGIHIITGGDDVDLARDGDHLTKSERYARTDEYLQVMRRVWQDDAPFDHSGRHYRVVGARSDVRPLAGGLPIYFGGASDEAIAVAGRHADIYALWGESREGVREVIERVRAAARPHGRRPRFSLSFRPIIAETEAKAWARAEDIYHRAVAQLEAQGELARPTATNAGSQRLRAAAAQGERQDETLWTKLAALTGGRWNSNALVGTADQVADALLRYHELGVTSFLIRGFEPLEDALLYGRELIPLLRERLRTRRQHTSAA
jgi:alkanesulfonate monooxygenase